MNDPQFVTDCIKNYIEDDAVMRKPDILGPNCLEYYSPKKDFKYEVIINENKITISSI